VVGFCGALGGGGGPGLQGREEVGWGGIFTKWGGVRSGGGSKKGFIRAAGWIGVEPNPHRYIWGCWYSHIFGGVCCKAGGTRGTG